MWHQFIERVRGAPKGSNVLEMASQGVDPAQREDGLPAQEVDNAAAANIDRGAWEQIQGARESQQDAADCLEWDRGQYLLIVADGIGGARGGDIASRTVVDRFCESFLADERQQPGKRLIRALQDANNSLSVEKQQKPDLYDMGTTLLAAASWASKLFWVSVGDSPLWLVRGRSLSRLNENHSIGGLMDKRVEKGEITPEEAAEYGQRNVLLSAVMGEDIELVDAQQDGIKLEAGDIVIAASDGVETCSAEEIVEICSAGRPQAADIAAAILDAVTGHDRPWQDNATLAVYRYW